MFLWPVRVYYEDTDSGGVIYYANYLKYMERARTEWLRGLAVEQDILRAQYGIIFAVHSVMVDFLKPGHFNELLHVSVVVLQQKRASLMFKQEIMRLPVSRVGDEQIDNTLTEKKSVICTGNVKIACLDAVSMRPRPIPAHILTEIACDS